MLRKRNKEKGQGLLEFALILPLLLLLLLGIVEAARIIWAYVTVQNAAREAARYAITGRPFACPGNPSGSPNPGDYCDDATQGDPWATQVFTSTRTKAIKEVAIAQGKNLAVSYFAKTDLADFNANKTVPGAFGVAIIGQNAANPGGLPDFGGDPGWNVRVETYYNVEMLDPIYGALLGWQAIHLSGQVELQNEGFDAAAKKYVGGISYQSSNCVPPNCGTSRTPYISVQDSFGDFTEPAGGNFSVSVNDHTPNTNYILWFVHETAAGQSYQLPFTTDNLGSKILNFTISVAASQGLYRIYTTVDGSTSPVASCLTDLPTNAPCFTVETADAAITARNVDGDVDGFPQKQQPAMVEPARWPISSSIPIYLFGHDINKDYTITFNGLNAAAAPGDLMVNGTSSNVIRTDSQFGSNLNNKPGYYIATGHSTGNVTITSVDPLGTQIATTTVTLVTAGLDIAGETPASTHPVGDILGIVLRDHAPLQQYQVFFSDNLTPPTIARTDENGELALNYVVPTGIYTPTFPPPPPVPVKISVYDYGRGINNNIISSRTFNVLTPFGPYLNIPGGARWPAGSPVTIQVRQHIPNTYHRLYLQQGSYNSPSFSRWIENATFQTTGQGAYDLGYIIPPDLGSPAGESYKIRSFACATSSCSSSELTSTPQAEYDIVIVSKPYITIDNGKRWPPGAKIVIRLGNHIPSTSHQVWIDRSGPQEQFLGTFIMDAFGSKAINYTIPISTPAKIEPGYTVASYLVGNEVARTDLEVFPADLVVTNIAVPNVTFDVEIPITLTIANNSPVTLTNSYFDTDMYIDPAAAPNLAAPLPPGEYKNWVNSIPASGTTTVNDTIVLFGQSSHQIYARADTSNLVAESNDLNNMTMKPIDAGCAVKITDEFDNGVIAAEWTQTSFGNSTPTSQIENTGALTLTNRGSGALSADDNGSGAGYHLMHRTVGTGPFEVAIRLDQTALNGSNGRAGLEVRANTDGTAAKLMFTYRSNGELQVFRRFSNATAASVRTEDPPGTPRWLRIRRNGDQFNFAYSTSTSDTLPTTWTDFHTINSFVLPGTVEVGLLNAPASSSTAYSAVFRHFNLCASSAAGGSSGQGYLGSRCGQVEENGNGLVIVDSINTIINQTGGGKIWRTVSMTNTLGEPSMEGMEVNPDTGDNFSAGVGPHATYQINIKSGGTYYVWVAGWGPNTSGDDVHVGLNGSAIGVVNGFPTGSASPAWRQMAGSVNINAGINTFDLWGKEDGARTFKILLTKNSGFTPPPDGMGQSACTIIAAPHIPPKLRQCTELIRRGNFEGTFQQVNAEWQTSGSAVIFSTVAYQSNRGAGFPVFSGLRPAIRQTVQLPTWILSNTTAILKLKKGVDLQGGNNPITDVLRFALRRDSDNFNLITPITLADGVNRTTDNPPIPDLDPLNPAPNQWTDFNQNIFNNLNPLSIMEPGEKVRVYFEVPNPGIDTSFFLDNISLEVCTEQPVPAKIAGAGHISGETRRSGLPLVGAIVWAYATADSGGQPGPVFKTYSIQDGTYRFYNLPPGEYLIYAQMTDATGTLSAIRRIVVQPDTEVKNVILNVITG